MVGYLIADVAPLMQTSSDTKVTSGVMIKITSTEGEESHVDVEAIDTQPLTPSELVIYLVIKRTISEI